jgi:hypothetical protein
LGDLRFTSRRSNAKGKENSQIKNAIAARRIQVCPEGSSIQYISIEEKIFWLDFRRLPGSQTELHAGIQGVIPQGT